MARHKYFPCRYGEYVGAEPPSPPSNSNLVLKNCIVTINTKKNNFNIAVFQ